MTNIVIGAGPVGQIAALLLKNASQDVLLIGKKSPKIDSMAFALHPKHLRLLTHLGLSLPQKPVYSMKLVFQKESTLYNQKPLCHIIRYNDLITQLSLLTQDIPTLTEKPLALRKNQLVLPSSTYTFKHLIACDGQHSWTRSQLNISTKQYHYHQFAHTAILTHTRKQTQALQVFSNIGTFATLPLPNAHQSALVFCIHEKAHQQLLEKGLLETLQENKLPVEDILLIEHHQYVPLIATRATQFTQDNVFLAGNALHQIHPLAGIGFNLALGDLDIILQTMLFKKDPHYYPEKRKRAHIKAHWITDYIARNPNLRVPSDLLKINSLQAFIQSQINEIC